MDAEELIKRGYRALGLGADDDVLAMFDQLGGEPAQWAVCALGAFGSRHRAGDVVAMELFVGLPSHFEVIGVELRTWSMNRRRTRLTVIGRYRARVRGDLGGAGAALHAPMVRLERARREGRQPARSGWSCGAGARATRGPAELEQPAPLGQASVLPVPPPGELELGTRLAGEVHGAAEDVEHAAVDVVAGALLQLGVELLGIAAAKVGDLLDADQTQVAGQRGAYAGDLLQFVRLVSLRCASPHHSTGAGGQREGTGRNESRRRGRDGCGRGGAHQAGGRGSRGAHQAGGGSAAAEPSRPRRPPSSGLSALLERASHQLETALRRRHHLTDEGQQDAAHVLVRGEA